MELCDSGSDRCLYLPSHGPTSLKARNMELEALSPANTTYPTDIAACCEDAMSDSDFTSPRPTDGRADHLPCTVARQTHKQMDECGGALPGRLSNFLDVPRKRQRRDSGSGGGSGGGSDNDNRSDRGGGNGNDSGRYDVVAVWKRHPQWTGVRMLHRTVSVV